MDIDPKYILEKALGRALGIDKYIYLMDYLFLTNVSTDERFQKQFVTFYIVRRNKTWRKIYFDYFELNKNRTDLTFEEILNYLYEKTGNIEPSFSSKMLATINPKMPIWDQYVVDYFRKLLVLDPKPQSKTKNERIKENVKDYQKIAKWYQKYVLTDNGQDCIVVFNNMLPRYSKISDVKKIDYLIWANRE